MIPAESIRYFNRYSGRIETEQVYGDAFLRWAYESRPGRLALRTLVKRAAFSRLYGWLMNTARSVDKIEPFLEKYQLDATEFARAVASYDSFNEFFFRALQLGARPVDLDPESAVFPADARHLGFHDMSQIEGVFVKGQTFDLAALLKDRALAERYARGTLVLSRLCPVDYHRFHFPICGVPGKPRVIKGPLFSVNPIALRRRLSYLWENKRSVTEVRSECFGTVVCLEIGATNVGSIEQSFTPDRPVAKGEQKGLFRFGGSSTITLFEPGRLCLANDLLEQTLQGRELYARMGDRMGQRA
ncbi:MAG: phosphatidylserine decarboxylase [Verrucomicrobiales bacterium]